MKKQTDLPENKVEIEVVMRKEMNITNYKGMMKQAKEKGWEVQAYQIGVYSIGLKKEFK